MYLKPNNVEILRHKHRHFQVSLRKKSSLAPTRLYEVIFFYESIIKTQHFLNGTDLMKAAWVLVSLPVILEQCPILVVPQILCFCNSTNPPINSTNKPTNCSRLVFLSPSMFLTKLFYMHVFKQTFKDRPQLW